MSINNVCLCGKKINMTSLHVKNDFLFCSKKCLDELMSDVDTIQSMYIRNPNTHSICQCGVIYPTAEKLSVYGETCCSITHVKKIRTLYDKVEEKTDTVFRKPDGGSGNVF
jgi:hypothetical protein